MSTLFWDVDDSENMPPRRVLEILWGDAMNHLKATGGEVFVPVTVVKELLSMEHLKNMAIRLSWLLNKEVTILMDESLDCYRIVEKGIDRWTTPEQMIAAQIPVGLDEHRLISKSIHHASDSVKFPARPAKVPRPPNCFILYRQANHQLVKDANPGVSNNEISRILGARWNNESPAIREQYTQLADDLKREHAIKHPDYQYAPRRPSERRRRITRNNTGGLNILRNDPHYQQMLKQAGSGSGNEQFLSIDDNFLEMLDSNEILYGPNGVAPLEAIFSHNDHQKIAHDLFSGSQLATMDYVPDSSADNVNINSDNQEMLVPNMF
ncbi:High mobility group superfamily [Penicillium paradoxum]|uniref:High mobility group superfamily n=1 Tax=Penicillium paradoxum TaxID=176176 RepID=UPI002546DA18|nr:High mobility group superfamily [Penicillium paradoxum]KAJ5780952.1 High mobility group superfamily [Penicillium paradoxum]